MLISFEREMTISIDDKRGGINYCGSYCPKK